MKFRVRFAEQVVGVFILLAILAVAAAMVLMGMNQRWFARNCSFRLQRRRLGTHPRRLFENP